MLCVGAVVAVSRCQSICHTCVLYPNG